MSPATSLKPLTHRLLRTAVVASAEVSRHVHGRHQIRDGRRIRCGVTCSRKPLDLSPNETDIAALTLMILPPRIFAGDLCRLIAILVPHDWGL